eukprot:1697074-Alexandrium_andersonii.AAC.1
MLPSAGNVLRPSSVVSGFRDMQLDPYHMAPGMDHAALAVYHVAFANLQSVQVCLSLIHISEPTRLALI